jgi:hypothetical protein
VKGHGIGGTVILQDMDQNVKESCWFQKIYGLGKVKLNIKWPGRLEKTQI